MSVGMLAAEHKGHGDLGQEMVSEDVEEQNVSMMVYDGLDDITFDADDAVSSHLDGLDGGQDDDAYFNPHTHDPELEQELPQPEDTTLDFEASALDDIGDAVDVVASASADQGAHVTDVLDDSRSEAGLGSAKSPAVTEPPASNENDAVSEFGHNHNEEVSHDAARQTATVGQPGPADISTAGEESGEEDEFNYEEGPQFGELEDLQHEASNPASGQDEIPVSESREDAHRVVGQEDDGEDYGIDVNDSEELPAANTPGSDEPDAHADQVEDHRDAPDEDHNGEQSILHSQEEKDHENGEEEVDYMEVAELESSEKSSTRPIVRIKYRDTTYSLLSTSRSDDPYSYFFPDAEALEYPLSQFLAGLREVLSEELTPDEELLIRIDGLGLEFAETMDRTSLDCTKFGSIVDLYDRLVKADDPDSQDHVLLVYLVTRPNAMRRLETLLDGASIGEGLSAYHLSYPDYLLRDFPPMGDAKNSSNGTTSFRDDVDEEEQFESDGHERLDRADHSSQQINDGSVSHGIRGETEYEHTPDDSNGQAIYGTHEEISVYSRNSMSREASPVGQGNHGSDSELAGREQTEILERKLDEAESRANDLASPLEHTDVDFTLDDGRLVGEVGEKASREDHEEDLYNTEHRKLSCSSENEHDIKRLLAREHTGPELGPGGGDKNVMVLEGEASRTADEEEVEVWDEDTGYHDAFVGATSDGNSSSRVPYQPDAEEDAVELHTPGDAAGEDWDDENAHAGFEVTVTDDRSFDELQTGLQFSPSDDIGPEASDHTSASGTLHGDEIDLEEVLGVNTPLAEDQANDNTGGHFDESHPEADEIDWDDTENADAPVDGITSTPSSITGKRVREADDGEASADGHDVKRHRA